VAGLSESAGTEAVAVGPPLWLLAELTYKCPLHCVFCYNPIQFASLKDELSTAQWVDVITQARSLGAAQLGFSGGEPLMRDDLEEIVQEAHRLGFYTNLITSGVGLTKARARRLRDAGLDHVQLSFQDSTKELNDFLSHTKTFALKQEVAKTIKEFGWPMVMNCVLHRHNLPHVRQIIDMAVELEAEYLELANTQFYGWAWLNRDQLMPTREALQTAEAEVAAYRAEQVARGGRTQCKVLFVVPDYYEDRPKACMNGWGSVFMTIAPDGLAMPCHNARDLPGLLLPNVKEMPISEIWKSSSAFNRFRGESWMKSPCRDCDERHKDFGGCRCQAFLITGDASEADPVCSKSKHHEKVISIVEKAQDRREFPIVFRTSEESLVRQLQD
jgi:pyrroloquinoline quinone biosynthesis protein E